MKIFYRLGFIILSLSILFSLFFNSFGCDMVNCDEPCPIGSICPKCSDSWDITTNRMTNLDESIIFTHYFVKLSSFIKARQLLMVIIYPDGVIKKQLVLSPELDANTIIEQIISPNN